MEYIIAEIIKTIKESDTAIIRETKLLQLFMRIFTEALVCALEIMDTELVEQYKKQGYQIERRDRRTIQGLFGTVTYQRRRIRKEGPRAKGFYPLDIQLGLKKYQRYTALFMKRVAEAATGSVYRTTADSINRLTLTSISHQTVGNIIKQVGRGYAEWEQSQEHKKAHSGATAQCHPPLLCLEGDGLLVKGQGAKQQEIHRIQISEGSTRCGTRTMLVHPHYFASMNHGELVTQVTAYLQSKYDLAHVVVVSNSDGGSGYGKDVFGSLVIGCKQHEHVLDRYHVNRKLKERLYFIDPALQDEIRNALREYRWEPLQVLLDTAESQAETPEEIVHVQKLRQYIVRNWVSLAPLKLRKIAVSASGIGTCESNHRIYSYRMKKQGRHWSRTGGTAMVKVITAIRNKELDQAFADWTKGFTAPVSRTFRGTMRRVMRKIPFQTHVGIHHGRICNNGPSSSVIGKLANSFSTPAFL
jgi:hypothetical protein